jgi:hypothetical protein
MTPQQARDVLATARDHLERWKAKLLPVAGQGAVIEGRTVTLEPAAARPVTIVPRTIMLHVWAQITMNQSMTGVVTLPPEYDESGSYVYPPFLVASLAFSLARSDYTWGTVQQVLPAAGTAAASAGELLLGGLWAGDYFEGTGPGYDVEITDLQKTATVTLYVRGRYAEDADYGTTFDDPATFETNFNVGIRTLGTLLEGNRANPLPDESQTGEVRAGYAGTTFTLEPISRGAYPSNALTSIFSITSISKN